MNKEKLQIAIRADLEIAMDFTQFALELDGDFKAISRRLAHIENAKDFLKLAEQKIYEYAVITIGDN